MSYSKAASLIGVSTLLITMAAHAQTTAPPGPAPVPAPPPPNAADPTAPTGAAAPGPAGDANQGMNAVPTGTQPPVTPLPPADGLPPAAAAPPVPPAEVAKPPVTPSTPMVSKWKASLYGFIELDMIHDSTQSFQDSAVSATAVARESTYGGTRGRTHFSARNSRFGFKINAPEYSGMKTSGTLEVDFFGNQPAVSESSTVTNGTVRLRVATIKVENPYVDILVGQTYTLFGWQPFFFPYTVSILPLMNQVFSRQPQLRLSHTFKSDDVNFEIAAAALRPPQRDAEVPDFQGGLRVGFPGWKGIHTLSSGGMLNDPITVGVSGAVRQFRVTEYLAAPKTSNKATGWGIAVNGFIPVIPASSLDNAGNALSLTGAFITGSGIADQGGFQTALPWPNSTKPPAGSTATAGAPLTPNIDPGLVRYHAKYNDDGSLAGGDLETIDWQGWMVGLQYYLPPKGKLSISGNYTQGKSQTLDDAKADYAAGAAVFRKTQYVDGNIFIDITPAFRTGLMYQYTWQQYLDKTKVHNNRLEWAFYCFF